MTVSRKRKGNVKVALNSNQVKSLQAGVHADGGLYLVVRGSGDQVWAFRFTDKVASKRWGVEPRVKKRAAAQGGKTFKEFAEEQFLRRRTPSGRNTVAV